VKKCTYGFNIVHAETDTGDLIALDGRSCLEIMYALMDMINYPDYEHIIDNAESLVFKNELDGGSKNE
jgi:hypothetical protein